MLVCDLMTRDPIVVAPDDSLQQAALKMEQLDVGAMPVCDAGRLVGVITDRDITIRGVASGDSPVEQLVSDHMTANVAYAFEDESAEAAIARMETLQIRRLMVLSRERKLVGILALGDLAAEPDALSPQQLAEGIGAISDPARPRK